MKLAAAPELANDSVIKVLDEELIPNEVAVALVKGELILNVFNDA
jgi:hypothetical protein